MHKADVAVLGAGPAGAVVGRELARAGVSVALIDPGHPPPSHIIESFPASGAPLAEAIGLLGPICGASYGPAAAMHMSWRAEPETRDFGRDGPLLMDRAALHQMLLAEACARSDKLRYIATRTRRVRAVSKGIAVETDAGPIRARLVIDARGRGSPVGRSRLNDSVALPFSGMQNSPLAPEMHLESLPDAWLWACVLGNGAVHGVLFQKADTLAGTSAPTRAAYGADRLHESRDFSGLQDCRFMRPSAAGFGALDDPVITPGHLVIGDAALARDPIASHGLVHAIRSAVQGAVVACTIIDPEGDSHAAMAFLRLKHREALKHAQAATTRAYADQARFGTDFWDYPSPTVPNVAQNTVPKSLSGPLRLARPLTRAPVLEGDRIRWAPAIERPVSDDFAITFGPVTALEIATACRPAAPLPEVAARLGRTHAAPVVMQALDQLIDGGALVQSRSAP